MQVELSSRAKRDLENLYATIGASISSPAAKWFAQLLNDIESLSIFPECGMRILSQRSNRRILFGRRPYVYRIVYRVEHDRGIVAIQRVEPGWLVTKL